MMDGIGATELQNPKLRTALAPNPGAPPAAQDTTLAPKADIFAEIDAADAARGMPPRTRGPVPNPDDIGPADFGDVFGAAWQKETIATDAWQYQNRARRDLALEMFSVLPAKNQNRVNALRLEQTNNWMRFEDVLAAEMRALAQTGPEGAMLAGRYPQDANQFDQRINEQLRAEYDQADAILGREGGGFAEFMGAGARAMTDQTSLALLPFGGTAAKGVLRFAAIEAGLGAAGELAIQPRKFAVADELGLPDPNPLADAAMGAVFGGAFGGMIAGAPKAWEGGKRVLAYAQARMAPVNAAVRAGEDALDASAAVDAAEAQMRGDTTLAEELPLRDDAAPSPLAAALAQPSGATYPGAESLPYNEAAVLRGIIGVESNNNPNAKNPNSTASGLGQFIYGTWVPMIKKYRPDLAAGKNDGEIWAMVGDGKLNAEMTAMYARENAELLQANNLTVDPSTIYLSHFMGPQAAINTLRAPLDTPISRLMSRRAISANAGIRYNGKAFANFTAGDLRAWTRKKMASAYDPNAPTTLPDFGPTTRGYTGAGQVSTASGTRVDVEYQVVDLSKLFRASGDLQPRDRSRITSDAQIADIAARLDPARLMPTPTAETGPPIVGPDNVIESGNGRFGAIERAYTLHPDRASAYRTAIEQAGFDVPADVQRPILIARRTSEMTDAERVQFTIDAQDAGVGVMTATETAAKLSRTLSPDVLMRFNPAVPMSDAGNGDFLRAALAKVPLSERNAMFDRNGVLNKHGSDVLREAMFARAWQDEDIIEMFAEEDPGDLGGLLAALAEAVPEWAALKADIEAGLVQPNMDISAYVTDAVRLIGKARQMARQVIAARKDSNIKAADKYTTADAVAELLDEVDLLSGPVAPLTVALVNKFWVGGKVAAKDKIAAFLSDYAADARRAGATGSMFDAPSPADVLRAIDKDTFGNLPDDLGPVRGYARPGSDAAPLPDMPEDGFDTGANSAEAEAIDTEIRAEVEADLTASANQPFGPVFGGFENDPAGAIQKLMAEKRGEVRGAFAAVNPALADVVLVYGTKKAGLAHIAHKHPAMLDQIDSIMREGRIVEDSEGLARRYVVKEGSPNQFVVIRLDYDGAEKQWIVTAAEDIRGKFDARQLRTSDEPAASVPSRVPDTTAQGIDTPNSAADQSPADITPRQADLDRAELDAARAELAKDAGLADIKITLADGTSATIDDMLYKLDQDTLADDVVQFCAPERNTP